MNDGDMDIVCLMVFLSATIFAIFYSYTPIV